MGNPEWIVVLKTLGITSALCPPVSGGIDDRKTTSLRMVGVREVLDPSNHGGSGQSIASGTIGIVLYRIKRLIFLSILKAQQDIHSMSRAPGRVIPSGLQPPPCAKKYVACVEPEEISGRAK